MKFVFNGNSILMFVFIKDLIKIWLWFGISEYKNVVSILCDFYGRWYYVKF